MLGRLVLIAVLLVPTIETVAQVDAFYSPGTTNNIKAHSLLLRLNKQMRDEMARNDIGPGHPLSDAYYKRTENLKNLVKENYFLEDSSINRFPNETFHQLLEKNPKLNGRQYTLLVAREAFPNAYCVGEKTFYVTTGFLAVTTNQSQLAAVLAHELAHYELNHMRDMMVMAYEASKVIKKEMGRASNGKVSAEGILEMWSRIFMVTRFSRKMEEEADSVGLVYLRNAGFRETESITMLKLFDPEDSLKGEPAYAFFEPLRSSRYPFLNSWLKRRASVYSKDPIDYLVPGDSMRTHPELQRRIQNLRPLVREQGQLNYLSDSLIARCAWRSRIESVEGAMKSQRMDVAMYEALKAIRISPGSPYLVAAIGRIFLKLCEGARDNQLRMLVPPYSAGFEIQLRQTNDFLSNLSRHDCEELGFDFMNRSSNFNENDEDHYYLLWKFSDMSTRSEIKSRIAKAYKSKYPLGEYRRLIE